MVFRNQTSDYTLGVEFGRFYNKMEIGVEVNNDLCHKANLDQLRDTSKFFGYEISYTIADDTWVYVTLTKAIPNERPMNYEPS